MSMRSFVIAGLALTLCTAARQDWSEGSAAIPRDDAHSFQRDRYAEATARRICAVDRLTESRLPRMICRTPREWRDQRLRWIMVAQTVERQRRARTECPCAGL